MSRPGRTTCFSLHFPVTGATRLARLGFVCMRIVSKTFQAALLRILPRLPDLDPSGRLGKDSSGGVEPSGTWAHRTDKSPLTVASILIGSSSRQTDPISGRLTCPCSRTSAVLTPVRLGTSFSSRRPPHSAEPTTTNEETLSILDYC